MTGFTLPAMLEAQRYTLGQREREAGLETAERIAEKYGLTGLARGEIPPGTRHQLESSLARALRDWDVQAARAGMPLSSVAERGREDVVQSYLEALSRTGEEAATRGLSLLARFLQAFAR